MNNKRKIITFSGRMRSGKGVLSNLLETRYNAKTFSMASHLKQLCLKVLNIECRILAPWDMSQMNLWKNENRILNENGISLSDASIRTISQVTGFDLDVVKENVKNVKFRNVRELLQLLGTDVIRKIDSEWHIKKTMEDIERLPESTIACVDDIRFKNELEAFRKFGADTFFIIRCNAENVSNHDSETNITHFDFPDNRIILNRETEKTLCDGFISVLENDSNTQTPILLSQFSQYNNVNRLFGTVKDEIVEHLVEENSTNPHFLKEGYITLPKNSKYSITEILDKMKIDVVKNVNLYEKENYYAIGNPIVFENLKRWL